MEGFNSRNGMTNNEYVGFDQFMVEHNFLANSQLCPNDGIPYNVQQNAAIVMHPPYPSSSNRLPQLTETQADDIVRNSNLLPTASEFVPQNSSPTVHDQHLQHPVQSMSSLQLNAAGNNDEKHGAIKKTFNRYTKIKENNQGGRNTRRNDRNREWNHRSDHRTAGSGRTASQYQYDDRDAYSRQNYQNYPKFDRNTYRNGDVDKDRRSHHYDRSRNNDHSDRTRNNDHSDRSRNNDHSDRTRNNDHSDRTRNNDYSDRTRNNDHSDNYNERKQQRVFDKATSSGAKGNDKILSITKPEETDNKCSQREKLIREIDAGKLECLICCENIKTWNQTWNCSNCFHIIHLNCVIKWANSSASSGSWRCPACQNISESIPKTYYCFCKKLQNPEYNRSDIAHSCGEMCGRTDGCEHSCKLLCHPGPCAPCQVMVTRECGCGRSKKTMQCCQKSQIQCDEICDKDLNCGEHRCTQKCHLWKCNDCEIMVEHKCYCGKDRKEMSCTQENNQSKKYSCGKPCNHQLSCKNHKCKETCHAGECGECNLSPEFVTSCPCGNTPLLSGERKSCSDPIPLCNSICGKPLKCGSTNKPHKCAMKCHNGICGPCNKETAVKCRCGNMDQMIKCRQLQTRADDARCKKRCKQVRCCGKHKCNSECCIDIDHICPIFCNNRLQCGKHKCDHPCHKGKCLPCYRSSFDELYCECGANVIYPPVPCGTKKPACTRPCSRPQSCDHPVQHNCHSGNCPPCMAFTTRYCHGKHEQRMTIPCSQEDFSCGMPCAKPLLCGQHKCLIKCHVGPCESERGECKQNCPKLRTLCGHLCNAPCHTGDCPETSCRETVEVSCECGGRKQNRSCFDFSKEYRRITTAKLASSMEDMQRGNSVELADVLGPMKITKTLECNDECRAKRMAIGLQIQKPDLSSKLAPKYSDFVRGWAKNDPALVKSIHDKLTELVKLAKESKQRSRSHSFPTMNREKRQLIHEMCALFGVQSVAYDAEPNRNVVATATKESTWLPSMSIFEVLQRESGQRRIPVPSNNVWGVKR